MVKLIRITTCHLLLLAVYFNTCKSATTRQHVSGNTGTSTAKQRATLKPWKRDVSTVNTRELTRTMPSWLRDPSTLATKSHVPAMQPWKRRPSVNHTDWNLRLDHLLPGHLLQQRWMVNDSMLTVKGCPSICTCVFIHDSIFQCMRLVVKDCETDPTRYLPKLFASHSNVNSLELNSCHLSKLPQEILKLKDLYGLYLIKNNFTRLSELHEMQHIWVLWIEENEAELVLTDITKLSDVKGLRLTGSRIALLPNEIGNLKNLIALNVSHNTLKSLPREIENLSQLQNLDISFNEFQVHTIPKEIGALSELQLLAILSNRLETLPTAIGKLTKLIYLVVNNNKIKALPKDVLELKQLQILGLANNRLREVPALPYGELSELTLEYNMIETLSCEIFASHSLTVLNLGYNDLKSFFCIKVNSQLTYLSLTHNALEDLSCEYYMVNLKHLDLSYNNILKIPAGCAPFAYWGAMKWLDISFNRISAIHFNQICPEDFPSAFNHLSFRNNRISTIDTKGAVIPPCFNKGAIINFANNRISYLDSWSLFIAQAIDITIDLSGNDLSNFTNSARPFFPNFKSGTRILLQQNRIRHFTDVFNGWDIIVNTTASLNTLLSDVHFDLGSNPLVCDCVDYEVYKYIQTLRTEQYKNLLCHEPLSLRGKNPQKIPLGNFVCDIKLNCPDGCNCTNVPYSQSIDIICRQYVRKDIPEIVPDLPNENFGYRLEICNQNLHEITSEPYLQKTLEILLSNNAITKIKIKSSKALQGVKVLHLDHNKLQTLPDVVAGMTNATAEDIRLGGNPWLCDCDVLTMRNWIMSNTYIVKDSDNILCHSPSNVAGVKVKDVERSMVCQGENMTAVYVVAAVAIVVAVILTYFAIVNIRKHANWRPVGSDECEGEHKEFDVFMCAANDDSDFVETILIPELERRDYRVCYHREHFCGGKPIHVNISEAIEKSKRTLVYFTNNFKNSEFSMFEFHSAYDLDIRNRTRRLVTIKDPDLDMSKLDRSEMHYFETYSYIRLEDTKFWNNLAYSLARQRLGAQVRLPHT